jgi:hypothetical protein
MRQSRPIEANQTLLDIAIQELGDASRANEIAVMNGMSITDDLQPGAVLLIPEIARIFKFLANIFKDRGNTPASAIIVEEGIEFWLLEKDFVVQ